MSAKLEIKFGYNPAWLTPAMAIYNRTELKRTDAEKVERAFKNSFAVVTCWRNGSLVGLGRMISDGEMYSAIYDVVVDPEFQKLGIGKTIMNALISLAPDTTFLLTSTLGNEQFYYNLGFRKHRTGMALYPENRKEHSRKYLVEEI